jgi:hypothetical protein
VLSQIKVKTKEVLQYKEDIGLKVLNFYIGLIRMAIDQ